MGFGAHGKKRHRLGDGGPSEFKRAFSGPGSGDDDARGSVTSEGPATQLRYPHFLTERPTLVNSDASSISTVAECHNADALSRFTSRAGNLSRTEWPDAWEQLSVDTECVNSEETWNWASSFSDLRSEVTVSGHDPLASSPDSHLIREQRSRVGCATSKARLIELRGNKSPDNRQVLSSRKGREGRAGHSARSYGGDSTCHVKDGAFRRDHAVETSSDLREFDEAAEQPQSAFSANPLENIPQKYSAGVCKVEQPRTSRSGGEDHMMNTIVSPDRKGEYSEGRSGGVDESLSDCPIGPSIEEDAFCGESKDNARCTSFVHSSGRLSLEERARLGERSRTIDHDFEDYFSTLLL